MDDYNTPHMDIKLFNHEKINTEADTNITASYETWTEQQSAQSRLISIKKNMNDVQQIITFKID